MNVLPSILRWLPALRWGSPPTSASPLLRSLQAPGFLIATGTAGSPPHLQAIGHADWRRTRPLAADTHMPIGSISKLFIGNLVLLLHDEGRLDLDAPLRDALPHLREIPHRETITLRHLARHTSGLPDAIYHRSFRRAILRRPRHLWTAEEILRHTFTRPPAFPPGASWQYSNTNTILLALAAEQASGLPYPRLLREKILQPLRLGNTDIPLDGELPAPRSRGYRYGRWSCPLGYGKILFDFTRGNASWTHAAGSLYSTVTDLYHAAAPLCLGHLLRENSRKHLHDWHPTGVDGYRYGFCLESWDGHIGHRGDVPGFQSLLALHPPTQRITVILTNLSNTRHGQGPANQLLPHLPLDL